MYSHDLALVLAAAAAVVAIEEGDRPVAIAPAVQDAVLPKTVIKVVVVAGVTTVTVAPRQYPFYGQEYGRQGWTMIPKKVGMAHLRAAETHPAAGTRLRRPCHGGASHHLDYGG